MEGEPSLSKFLGAGSGRADGQPIQPSAPPVGARTLRLKPEGRDRPASSFIFEHGPGQSLSGGSGRKPLKQVVGFRKQVVGYLAPVIGTKGRAFCCQLKKS